VSVNSAFVTSDAFWQYSLRVYGAGQTKDCLLYLQDEANLNVNILLFSGFLASKGYMLYATDIVHLFKAIKPLDERTKRLRAKRIRFALACSGQSKCKLSAYYKALMATEIMSEKEQQEAIVKAAIDILKRPVLTNISYAFQNLKSELVKSAYFYANNNLDCPGLDLSPDKKLEKSTLIRQKISVLVQQFSTVGR
jgi:uncharacterized protein (TIGR02444 family)